VIQQPPEANDGAEGSPSEPLPASIPPEPRPRWRRILPIALGVGAFLLAGFVARTVLTGNDAYEQTLIDQTNALMETAEFEARYGSVSNDQAESIGYELGARGVTQLPDAELEDYFRITIQIVESLEDEPCARLIGGTLDGEEVLEAARELEIETFRHYFEILMAGARSELEGNQPPDPPSNAELDAALRALTAELGEVRAMEVFTIVSEPASQPAAETCTATLEMLRGILELPLPERQDLLRFIASQAAPG
jgi:hypothetical protein